MTKDEMKNRISLALKDPILQQGFEIICIDIMERVQGSKYVRYLCRLGNKGVNYV